MKKHIIFVYEEEQITAAQDVLRSPKSDATHILCALRADLEPMLEAAGMSYISAAPYRESNAKARMETVEGILGRLEKDSILTDVQHRGVSLFPLQSILIQDYLTILFYWLEIIANVVREHAPTAVTLWHTKHVVHQEKKLSHRTIDVVVRAAVLVTGHHRLQLHLMPHQGPKYFWYRKMFFYVKRTLFSIFIFFVNTFVRLRVTRREMRLLIADVWRNVGSYAAALPQAELVMMDRVEYFNMGWKNIIKHRTQFIDDSSYSTFSHRRTAIRKQREVKNWWSGKKDSIQSIANIEWQGISLTKDLFEMLEMYSKYSVAEDILEIERIKHMLETLSPDVVLVRASASKQKHLMLLCLLAKQLSIPSIEPQHGWYYLGPSGTPRRSVVEYMATYGPFCSRDFTKNGFAGQCKEIGSPRFDVYKDIPPPASNHSTLKVLIGLVDDMTGRWTDTYDIQELIQTIKQILEATDDIEIILKAKPHSVGNSYGFDLAEKELSQYKNFTLVTKQPMHDAIQEANVVMSIYSTIILESMLAGRPVLYWAKPAFHKLAHDLGQLDEFKTDADMKVVESTSDFTQAIKELRDQKVRAEAGRKAQEFMRREFSFGPGSSKRLATLVEDLSQRNG